MKYIRPEIEKLKVLFQIALDNLCTKIDFSTTGSRELILGLLQGRIQGFLMWGGGGGGQEQTLLSMLKLFYS